jgi:hypothetical protein
MRSGRAGRRAVVGRRWRGRVAGPAVAARLGLATAHGRRRFSRTLVLAGVLGVVFAGLLGPGVAAAAPGDVLVADFEAFGFGGGVIGVDPATGARTTVSANDAPAGAPDFVDPRGVAVEADGDILVADQTAFGFFGGVIRVDPATGARTTVSANGAPAGGPAFENPFGVAVEADGDILVADRDAFANLEGGVIRVDPATGARTALSANDAPTGGPDFANPVGMALEADGEILVADPGALGAGGRVIRVDPATGARTALSTNGAPAGGPAFALPFGVAVVPAPPDGDGDGVPDAADNCAAQPNPDQRDLDGDGAGDGCDADDDNDGAPDAADNCAAVPNPDQRDLDGDGAGDGCDADDDNDGAPDTADNCATQTNPGQADLDADGAGDGCDPDDDNDGALDAADNCLAAANADQADIDGDGAGDGCDSDDDNDRLSDGAELRLGSSSADLDSDDDGLADGREDRNRDGRRGRGETDPARFDTDRDRLPDGLELGLRRGIADPPGPLAGSGPRFRADRHPKSKTRPLRRDSDGGGVADGREDRNRNGRVDRGETDPNKPGKQRRL